MRGVVRIEIDKAKKTYGWQARLYCGKKAETRFFSDSHYGGKQGSYEAACQAREMMVSGIALPPPINRRGRRPVPVPVEQEATPTV